jgi:hypothetical protein
MTTEFCIRCAAAACAGEWTFGEAMEFTAMNHTVRIPANGTKDSGGGFHTAEQAAMTQQLLCFFEDFLGTGSRQSGFKTFTHINYSGKNLINERITIARFYQNKSPEREKLLFFVTNP